MRFLGRERLADHPIGSSGRAFRRHGLHHPDTATEQTETHRSGSCWYARILSRFYDLLMAVRWYTGVLDSDAAAENTRFLRLPHPRTRESFRWLRHERKLILAFQGFPCLFLPYSLPATSDGADDDADATMEGTRSDPERLAKRQKTRKDGLLEVQSINPEEEKKRCWFWGEEVVSGVWSTLSLLSVQVLIDLAWLAQMGDSRS